MHHGNRAYLTAHLSMATPIVTKLCIKVSKAVLVLETHTRPYQTRIRAPMTGALIVFEMSQDYGMVLPAMLACGIGSAMAKTI